jgi:ABC transporter, ATP-binding protein
MFGSGINLSGGEQQRVAIARALLVDAPVLILDEATAFTDPESEAEIQKALTTLVRGRTVLVIAHRPESILGVDQIAVLDHGNLVACGAPNDVIDHPLFTGLARISSGHNTEDLS